MLITVLQLYFFIYIIYIYIISPYLQLLRRNDFHVVEKVYDDGLNYVLVSGANQARVPFIQVGLVIL